MKMNTTWTKVFMVSFAVLIVMAGPSFAVGIDEFFRGTSGFLVKTIGTGVFSIGLIVAGIKIAGGDQAGLRNAILVMVGGAVIFLAQPVVNFFKELSQ